MLTLTDLFCGAGGSSTGAIQVPGIEVRYAANHWDLAIETHNRNHPDTVHLHENISQFSPERIASTDILWASPECTNHSRAKGRKQHLQPDLFGETLTEDAVKRSRATMWDVIRFTEQHRYQAVLVENVVEVADWGDDDTARGGLFQVWLMAMHNLGYKHRIISLNAMHAGIFGQAAPQSRDRVYIAFWRRGNPAPDFEEMLRPQAYCGTCDEVVRARQWWKKGNGQDRPGRYRAQYLYRCPNTACHNAIVEPAWVPASSIIDWSDLGTRIGDRDKPLADKTMRRIQMGIERHWTPVHVEHNGNGYDAADPKHPRYMDPESYYRAWPVAEPFKTQHTRESKGIALHPLMTPAGGTWNDTAEPVDKPFRTRTTRESEGLAFPPLMVNNVSGSDASRSTPISGVAPTIVAGGLHASLVTHPEAFSMAYYGSGVNTNRINDTVSTITTVERHALITRMNSVPGDPSYLTTPQHEPVRTITTAGHQALLNAQRPTVDIADVHFRMLNPTEIKQAMAFPKEYEMVGTRREQVKMSGNAVCPPAARDLIQTVADSLGFAA